MPTDLPPWYTIYQQAQRWIRAGVFAAMANDLRALLRLTQGCQETSGAVMFGSRTLLSTVESGERAGYEGTKRK